MKRKGIFFAAIVLLCAVLLVIYVTNNGAEKKRKDAVSGLLKIYYSADDDETLDKVSDGASAAGEFDSTFEALYNEKYIEYLTKDAYERLSANRTILEPEKIVRDFGCTLKFIEADISKSADSAEGHPVYSYNARINVTLPDNENREIIETGTVEFVKEENQWKVDLLNVKTGELYDRVKDLAPAS